MEIMQKGHHYFSNGKTGGMFSGEIAEKAVKLVLPTIFAMFAAGTTKRQAMHIVVGLKDQPIFEYSIGDRETWSRDYRDIATGKFELGTGPYSRGSSAYVQHMAPHLLNEGDTLYWGNAEIDGINVAISGDFSFYDEMWATMIAAAVRALCKKKYEEIRAKGKDFLEAGDC